MYTASFLEVSGTYSCKSSLLSSEASAISETSCFSCAVAFASVTAVYSAETDASRSMPDFESIVRSVSTLVFEST